MLKFLLMKKMPTAITITSQAWNSANWPPKLVNQSATGRSHTLQEISTMLMEMALRTTFTKPKMSSIDSESQSSENLLMISTTPSTETTQDILEPVRTQSLRQVPIQTVPPNSLSELKTWLLLKAKKWLRKEWFNNLPSLKLLILTVTMIENHLFCKLTLQLKIINTKFWISKDSSNPQTILMFNFHRP